MVRVEQELVQLENSEQTKLHYDFLENIKPSNIKRQVQSNYLSLSESNASTKLCL